MAKCGSAAPCAFGPIGLIGKSSTVAKTLRHGPLAALASQAGQFAHEVLILKRGPETGVPRAFQVAHMVSDIVELRLAFIQADMFAK